MKNNGITEYLEDVESEEEYDGYFCSVPDVINEKDNMLYVNYDFGDNRIFVLKLERIFDEAEAEVKEKQIPCVKSGKGFGIIDDCGGVYGLDRFRGD